MCLAVSAIVVYGGNDRITVYTSDENDSHETIRRAHNICDDLSAGATRQCPAELVPVRGLRNVEDFDFKFDAGRPNWWTDAMTDEATRQMHAAWMRRWDGNTLRWSGNLDLRSVTTIPEGVSFDVGGSLYLDSVTTIPEGVSFKTGGSLYLDSVTTIPAGVSVKVTGTVYLKQ